MHWGRVCRAFGAVLILVFWGCGSAAEFDALSRGHGSGNADDNSNATVLAHYEFFYNPLTQEQSLTPSAAISAIGETLLMSAADSARLASVLASVDVQLANWSASDWDEGNNGLEFSSAAITNRNSDPSHYHYQNLAARFTVFSPTSVNMTTSPTHVTCGTNGCTLDFSNVPYNATSTRDFFLFDPAGTAFKVGIQFEATLTSTSPTSYISNVDTVWLPLPSYMAGTSVTITGLGFGATPTVKVGSTTVTTSSASNTQVTVDTSQMLGLTGVLTVTNGATVINGPYIKSRTLATLAYGLNSGDIARSNAKLYLMIWNGTGTPSAGGCPPTSNFGTYDVQNISPIAMPLSAEALGEVISFLDVSGSGFKLYIAIDKSNNGLGVDASNGEKDYYYYATGQTITALSDNYLGEISQFGTPWSSLNNSNTACP